MSDKVVNKVFKGYFRDCYDNYLLSAPVNAHTQHPIAPSRQQLAQWVVESWEKITKELVVKAWSACGYLPYCFEPLPTSADYQLAPREKEGPKIYASDDDHLLFCSCSHV